MKEMERDASITETRDWIPVENIKVRVRRWFTIKTDYTDANEW